MSAGIFVSAGESAAHIFKKSAIMSAALNFGKERRVSGAHKNDERTKGLSINDSHTLKNVILIAFHTQKNATSS